MVREKVYLRFGAAPEGERSYDATNGRYEEGVSVFEGYRRPGRGGYAFDVPRELSFYPLAGLLLLAMTSGHPLFVATGTEVGRGEYGGEPLLRDVILSFVSPLKRVELPSWYGPEARELAKRWNRWRRNQGKRPVATQYRPGIAEEQAVRALVETRARCLPAALAAAAQAEASPEELRQVARALRAARRSPISKKPASGTPAG